MNVFENLISLYPAARDELSLVTEEEYVGFDDTLQCSENSGNTADEIAELVVSETLDSQVGLRNAATEEDSEEADEVLKVTMVRPNRFSIENNQDMKDVLEAIETYYSNNNSINLPLCFQLRSRDLQKRFF